MWHAVEDDIAVTIWPGL